jgi:hypothetical protein
MLGCLAGGSEMSWEKRDGSGVEWAGRVRIGLVGLDGV